MTQLPIYIDHDELTIEEFMTLKEKCLEGKEQHQDALFYTGKQKNKVPGLTLPAALKAI